MIYDELLDRIAQKGLEPYGNVMPTHLVLALRAVVKLHTPRKAYFGDDEIVCRACGSADIEWTYPCPTIQAIEKELS